MLGKRYQFHTHENDIYTKERKYFSPKKSGNPYSIIMPPPNVTGVLHLGHALNYSLQDILVRFYRMRGYNVLWQPGTDHAGIATQIVVEKKLKEKGVLRKNLSRDEFLKECWSWKDYSQNKIVSQQKRLGISPDWERTCFTLDEGVSKAVVCVFKRMYDEGLIYKDKRLVNWDFSLNTALSDLEVEQKEISGKFYHIAYPLKDNSSKTITIATTRPETLFGDTAIAVHPDDERYKDLIGKQVAIPLSGKEIPIIADEYSDPEKGTGAVKITPAHDFNDYDVGRRHALPIVNIFDKNACLNTHVPEDFKGLSITDARTKVVEWLGDALVKVEDIKHTVPISERTGERIEPYLTDQWYVDAKKLAEPALKAIEKGELNFIPKQWVNTYNRWLLDIQPWCISRQLWWGHRIPVWYGPCGKSFCAESKEEAYEQAKSHYQKDVELTQDPDVLDTWFSSALWPFTTLGWPSQTEELEVFFPTSVLVTGFDIIFFWVTRMVMMSYYIFNKSPFKDVYVHALVRDEKGNKMSKSKGNIIDPIALMDKYGADTLRLALCALSVPGRDVALGEKVVSGYGHFITKLWNAGRFLEMQKTANLDVVADSAALHQWMHAQINSAISEINEHIESYRFDLYAKTLYKLVWSQFCDIYLEAFKHVSGAGAFEKAREIFLKILKLCHPTMPFITEVLADHFGQKDLLIISEWPGVLDISSDEVQRFENILAICDQIKMLKNALDLKGKIQIAFASETSFTKYIQNAAQVEIVGKGEGLLVGDMVFVGVEPDRTKLSEKIKQLETDLVRCEKLLSNERFKIEKPDVYEEKIVLKSQIEEKIAVLGGLSD